MPVLWWLVLTSIFLVGVFAQVYALAAFSLMVTFVALLAYWWNSHALEGVSYRRRPYFRRGFPGEKIVVRLEVENRKFLPVSWLRVSDIWPVAVAPEDESTLRLTENPERGFLVNLFALRWYERTRRTYQLLLRKRGVYPTGPAILEAGDLFGFFEQAREDERGEYLTVFPLPLPFDALQLPANNPFGERRSRRRVYEDINQPMGVREYHPEDDFRRIHWPATAHTGDLQVKVYQPTSSQVMVICLNVSTLLHYWEGTYVELLEHLVQVTTTLVQKGLQSGYRVGLISNGCLAHADQPFRVPPGRSPAHQVRLLETLAGVTPFVSGPFERLLMVEVPRLPYGATLVVVTGLVTPALAEALARLKQRGRRITLLDFEHKPPPPLSGIQVVHLPFTG